MLDLPGHAVSLGKRLTALAFCAAPLHAQEPASAPIDAGRWAPTLESIAAHEAPQWLLDAKLGIQFVGAPGQYDDQQWYHWSRSAQRARELGFDATDEAARAHLDEFAPVVGVDYVRDIQALADPDKTMQAYRQTGARFLVSMLHGAYPGTEGLRMTRSEVDAARRAGLNVGIHYNLIRRGRTPSLGDPGYVDWWHDRVSTEVESIGADFVFFDGSQGASSAYLRTVPFVAWYYNWADASGRNVWVNDDLGIDLQEGFLYGDVWDLETKTFDAVAPGPFINWDTLRNEWNTWINEFGRHRRNGDLWEWVYRDPADLLQVFIHNVSIGGVWVVQMVNTVEAWERMRQIGDWLAVNGEAIYGTRPFRSPDPNARPLPDHLRGEPAIAGTPPKPADPSGVRWWQFQQTVSIAEHHGPFYFTRRGDTVYAIYWGLPEGTLTIPGIMAAEGAVVRVLGVDGELEWEQQGEDIAVAVPAMRDANFAVSFVIAPASAP